MFSHDDLKDMLDYDPATGHFTWKSRADTPVWWNSKYAGKRAGSLDAYGYCVLRINSRTYKAHRIAWFYMTGAMPSKDVEIDHINGDRIGNSFANLRLADDWQNAANAKTRKDNTSGAKGVSWHKRIGKWQAQISDAGKHKSLGYFESISKAQEAYRNRSLELHGEFARAA